MATQKHLEPGLALVVIVALSACTSSNEEFCAEATDCTAGKECNLVSRLCEVIPTEGTFAQLLVPNPDLDVLFVVDNSGSMTEEQDQLASEIQHFFGELDLGSRPNLHVGVVSTDMGAGPFGIMGCTGIGDGGQLQNAPAGACEAPTARYMEVSEDGLTKNFLGSPEEVFACIARLGTGGCGFEQHFASVQEALRPDHPTNAGFVRADAFLSIINVTDEDDCSASDDQLYDGDPALDRLDSDLGFLSSYRCFDHGVTCNETDPDPVVDRTNRGARTGCKSNDESLLLKSAREHAEFLRGLKQGRPLVWTVNIAGPSNSGSATIVENNGAPALEASCTGGKGTADPGFRLTSATAEFGLPEPVASICDSSYEIPLRGIANTLSALLSGDCLAAQPRDLDASAGLQTDCHIFDTVDGGRGELVASFAQCKEGADKPCFTLESDAASCPTGAGLRVVIDRKGVPVPQGSAAVLRCTAE